MQEKLSSESHKDWFVKKVSKSLDVSEQIVEKIIRNQFEGAISAMQKNKRIEISGIGVFIWNDKSAQRKLDSFDNQVRSFRNKILKCEDDKKIQHYTDVIDDILLKRQVLINRINELHSDLRRLEKQSNSRKRSKGSDNQG
jgi:hypothetical protein